MSEPKIDVDFLGNEINVGDKVIFEAPRYRDFVIGKVISKSPKTCQVEFLNTLNNSKGFVDVFRQFYGQLIKLPEPRLEAEWVEHPHFNFEGGYSGANYECSNCHYGDCYEETPYCPKCGAKMKGLSLNG